MNASQPVSAARACAPHDGAAIVRDRFARSIAAARRFFESEAAAIAIACQSMASRFEHGGTLMVFGEGAQASDANHVSVEFVHPVIVGKRALPSISFTSDAGVLSGSHLAAPHDMFARRLRTLAAAPDMALGLSAREVTLSLCAAMETARARGILTLLFMGRTAAPPGIADIEFVVDESDPLVVQEVHETLYHVLWELVHVFFEQHESAVSAPALDAGDERAYERQLYPFAFGLPAAVPEAIEAVVREVAESTRQKCRDICELREAVSASSSDAIARAGVAMASRIAAGGRILAFGNGGSATDAQDVSADCAVPPVDRWAAVPALALTDDIGVITAVGNDVGFDHVFARQIAAFGRSGDIALAFSTSGASRNVIAGLEAAKRRGLLTIALTGYDGGAIARSSAVDFCFAAGSEWIPRIQEAHATIWHGLVSVVQAELARAGAA